MIVLAAVPLFLIGLVVTAILSLPAAFIVMLLLGALHSYVAAVPALGFIPTYLAYLIARLVFGDSPNSDS